MRRRWVVAVGVGCLLIGGCGSDGDPPAAGGAATGGAATGGAATATATSGADSGGGDTVAAADVCKALTAADVGTAVGAKLTGKDVPGGGCSYDDDVYGIQVSTVEGAGGGYESYVSGLTGSLTKSTKTTPGGIGDRATVVAGKNPLDSTQAGAVAEVGKTLVTVSMLQRGSTPAAIATSAEKVLKVAVDKLT